MNRQAQWNRSCAFSFQHGGLILDMFTSSNHLEEGGEKYLHAFTHTYSCFLQLCTFIVEKKGRLKSACKAIISLPSKLQRCEFSNLRGGGGGRERIHTQNAFFKIQISFPPPWLQSWPHAAPIFFGLRVSPANLLLLTGDGRRIDSPGERSPTYSRHCQTPTPGSDPAPLLSRFCWSRQPRLPFTQEAFDKTPRPFQARPHFTAGQSQNLIDRAFRELNK